MHSAILMNPYQNYREAFALLDLVFQAHATKVNSSVALEPEVLHKILRHAHMNTPLEERRGCMAEEHVHGEQDMMYLVMGVPDGAKVQSVLIKAQARDQGWASDPGAGSWTWMEMAWLDKTGQELPDAGRVEVYRNKLGRRDWQMHQLVVANSALPADQPCTGAQLALFVRSRFPGWTHDVNRVDVTAAWDAECTGFVPLLRPRSRQPAWVQWLWSTLQTTSRILHRNDDDFIHTKC